MRTQSIFIISFHVVEEADRFVEKRTAVGYNIILIQQSK